MVKVKEDLTGRRFEHWLVIKQAEDRIQPNGEHVAQWECQCDCVNQTIQIVLGYRLRNKTSTRCRKCSNKAIGDANAKDYRTKSRLYHIWWNMKTRCYSTCCERYSSYGGRGIKMCDEWKNSYDCFRLWAMENGYSENLTIERIDVNGDYCPENCKWATTKEQGNNRRTNRNITFNGETHTLREWADIVDVPYHVLKGRLNKCNWSIDKAFTTPVKKYEKRQK